MYRCLFFLFCLFSTITLYLTVDWLMIIFTNFYAIKITILTFLNVRRKINEKWQQHYNLFNPRIEVFLKIKLTLFVNFHSKLKLVGLPKRQLDQSVLDTHAHMMGIEFTKLNYSIIRLSPLYNTAPYYYQDVHLKPKRIVGWQI